MLAFFERLFDPVEPAPVVRPPDRSGAFFLHFLWPIRGLLLAALAASGVAALSETALYVFLGVLVDWMAETERGVFLAVHGPALIAMAVIAIVVRPASVLVSRGLISLALVPGLSNRVRWRNYRYVLRQSVAFFQNDFAGRIAQKVMQTGPSLREAVVNVLDGIWFLSVFLVALVVLLASLDARLLLPVGLWAVGYLAVIRWMVPPVRRRSAGLSEAMSVMTGRVVDGYTNIQSVKLFAHAEREEAFAREAVVRHTQAFRNLMRSIFGMTVLLTVLNSALILAMAVLSIAFWLNGSLSLGAVAIANGLVIRLNQTSGWVLRTITNLFENIGTVQNGIETISRPSGVADRTDAPPLVVDRGAIRFEGIRFHYGKDGGVIDDLSLAIKPGEKVGLVGPSGAGKSTLVNLLLRFYDLEGGRILIDDQDVALVSQSSLRAQIAMVTQETSLLHRSIRENIRYGRPEADDAAILRAATLAEAHTFIPDLTDQRGRAGYDAHVGERGVKLSGGQRQRIAIARVILKDAPIIILDEATAALDSEAEAAIQGQLTRLMEGKTVIAIAHRLSTIAALDRLVVMDRGGIVEDGSHADLLRRDGLYARLWSRQSGGFLGEPEPPSALKVAALDTTAVTG